MYCTLVGKDSEQAACANAGWLFPLEALPDRLEPLGAEQVARWVRFFLILGIAARAMRYVLRFPIWADEAFLSVNLIDRGYLDLAGPLDYYQVCPLGFLWVQRAMVGLFGFNEYALRLFPFLCGLVSLFLFWHLAGRLLKGTALVAAVGIFAVAYPAIRYAAEAKQYGADLFVAMVMLAMAVEWWRRPAGGWLWALVAITPLAIWLSYPAAFVGGGVSLFLAGALWSRRARRGWILWLAYNVVLVTSFAGLFVVSAIHQSDQSLGSMLFSWERGFPPWQQPLKLVGWLIDAHTSDMLAYPVGGHHGGSALTFLLCVAAIALLVRKRQWLLLGLFLAPLALTFVAAVLHRYPYGQMVKFQIYLAPAFCTLAGLGLAVLLGLRRSRPIPRRSLGTALIILAAIGAASIARDCWRPTKTPGVLRARDFARWFWFTSEYSGEAVCLKSDLQLNFSPETYAYGFSAVYLCNQRIYSRRHARGESPQWDRVSADWPLRCIEYRSAAHVYDEQAAARWLKSMQRRYTLVSRERYPFVDSDGPQTKIWELDYVQVYKFIPKPSVACNAAPPLRR